MTLKKFMATPEITEELRKSVDEQVININTSSSPLKSLLLARKSFETTRGQRIGFIIVNLA